MAKKGNYFGYSNINQLVQVEKLKRLEQKIDDVLPNVYASFAIILVDKYGFSKQDIADIFQLSADLWNETADKKVSMRQWCMDLTGLDVQQMARHKAKTSKTDGVEVYSNEY